jgi:hypothetical protein
MRETGGMRDAADLRTVREDVSVELLLNGFRR